MNFAFFGGAKSKKEKARKAIYPHLSQLADVWDWVVTEGPDTEIGGVSVPTEERDWQSVAEAAAYAQRVAGHLGGWIALQAAPRNPAMLLRGECGTAPTELNEAKCAGVTAALAAAGFSSAAKLDGIEADGSQSFVYALEMVFGFHNATINKSVGEPVLSTGAVITAVQEGLQQMSAGPSENAKKISTLVSGIAGQLVVPEKRHGNLAKRINDAKTTIEKLHNAMLKAAR